MLSNQLTRREREVLALIAVGFTDKGIAQKLGIATPTVMAHRNNVRIKLDLHNIAAMTRYAVKYNLVSLDGEILAAVDNLPQSPA